MGPGWTTKRPSRTSTSKETLSNKTGSTYTKWSKRGDPFSEEFARHCWSQAGTRMKDRVRETLVQGKQTLVTPGEAGEGCGLFVILCNSHKGSLYDLDNHIVLAHTGGLGAIKTTLSQTHQRISHGPGGPSKPARTDQHTSRTSRTTSPIHSRER